MKKLFAVFLSAVMPAFLAAEAVPLTFEQLRCGQTDPAQLGLIRSVKLVYQVTSWNRPIAKLVIRAAYPEQFRIDVVSPDDAYTVCQNGKSAWGYSDKDGIFQLNAEEMAELRYDADILPVRIFNTPVFADPAAKGEEKADNVPCLRYETRSLRDKNLKMTFWVEKSTRQVRKAESEYPGGKSITVFRNHQNIQGIRVAAQIYMINPDGFYKLILHSAVWNPVFAGNLFLKPASAKGLKVKPTGTPAAYTAAEPRPRKAAAKEITALKQRIARLKIQIQDKEKQLARLEKTIDQDRNRAASLASASAPTRYRTVWGRGRFIIRRPDARSTGIRRKMISRLDQESKEAKLNYDTLNRELVELRIQLSDAQIQLEQISGK